MRKPALVPQPAECQLLEGGFDLTSETRLTAPALIADLVRELLTPATGFAFPEGGTSGISLVEVDDPALGPEGYRLAVTPRGVHAEGGIAGLRWAVQTLRQLLPPEVFAATATPAAAAWSLPCVEILDRPRLGWRSSLLDVGRWYQPIDFVHRYVDLMALHKLNILHLHLTEDQGWRFEVAKYPRLCEIGAWRRESMAGYYTEDRFDATPHGGFYTQKELRDLVDYAARRGVQIMPEIDLPGHMQAAIAAYPQLGNNPDAVIEVRTRWGVSDVILNTEPKTVDFVRDVLDEVADVFPFDYVHLGGDEVPTVEWAVSARARAHAAIGGFADVSGLLGWWCTQGADHVARLGRKPAFWDEVIDSGAPEGALIFAWQNLARVDEAAGAGFEVVACPQEHTYLDFPESLGPDEPVAIKPVARPVREVYDYRPQAVTGIAGQMWTEYTPSPALIEYRAFPRLAAVAESGWSTAPDFPGFRERLASHLERLDVLGVHYRPLDAPEG